jgi:hypothetical protein
VLTCCRLAGGSTATFTSPTESALLPGKSGVFLGVTHLFGS